MTQAYQAALLQLQIEDLRRLQVRADRRLRHVLARRSAARGELVGARPRTRPEARRTSRVRDACRPVLPMVEPRAGLVHVVNDTRDRPARRRCSRSSVDGRVTRWTGDIPADGIAFVGRVELADAVDVEVVLEHPTPAGSLNRYPLLVLRAGDARRPA